MASTSRILPPMESNATTQSSKSKTPGNRLFSQIYVAKKNGSVAHTTPPTVSYIYRYRLAQLTFPQAKRMIDVGGNRGFVGALMLSLWGGNAYVTPWNLHTEVQNSGHFAMNRHTYGFCKTGRDRGIAWNCHQNARDVQTGACVGSGADIRVISFDASSYTASSMNSVIQTIQQSKPALRLHTWKFEHMAVSNEEGTAQFPAQSKSSRPGFEGGHLLRTSETKVDYETVPVVTLDAYLARNDFGDVDILKIDAEGHDAYVLEGAVA